MSRNTTTFSHSTPPYHRKSLASTKLSSEHKLTVFSRNKCTRNPIGFEHNFQQIKYFGGVLSPLAPAPLAVIIVWHYWNAEL